MNCAQHPDVAAIAYCRVCGKPLCESCRREWQGAVFCSEHVPAAAPPPGPGAPAPEPPPYGSPYAGPYAGPPHALNSAPSPGLAFLLGFIPGVGAIYNGQYVKGIVHVIVLGILISIVSTNTVGNFEPLFGMMIAAWFFYMAFEAYHTARNRLLGLPVDEFSSLVPLRRDRRSFPAGPIMLIGFGVLFLLNTLDILHFDQIVRYWPIALIALGAYMLYERIAGSTRNGVAPEVHRERS